ncbi:MAG: response regulator [Bacteroidia bacterium]
MEVAENGLLAVECMKRNNYDLILMDAHMPEMDGLEATRQIRKLADPVKNSIPIIALTASVHKAEVDKCYQSGMNDFVPKPFTHDELLGAMAKYYKNSNPTGPVSSDKNHQNEMDAKTEIMENVAGGDEITNLDFLKEFSSGNPDRMKKYIGLYLKLVPDNLLKITDAISQKDFEGLVKVIHSMRPHLNYMGMKKAGEWASEIESSIRNEERDLIVFEKAGLVKEHCVISQDELREKMEKIA